MDYVFTAWRFVYLGEKGRKGEKVDHLWRQPCNCGTNNLRSKKHTIRGKKRERKKKRGEGREKQNRHQIEHYNHSLRAL